MDDHLTCHSETNMSKADHSEEEYLYGDLLDTQRAAPKKRKITSEINHHSCDNIPDNRERDTIGKVPVHNKEVEKLKEENQQLKRNIGTLYRTAKTELKRKDEEISRLLRLVDELQTRK